MPCAAARQIEKFPLSANPRHEKNRDGIVTMRLIVFQSHAAIRRNGAQDCFGKTKQPPSQALLYRRRGTLVE
jgi:hypothetical protein